MSAYSKVKNIIVSTHDSLYPIHGGGALRTLKVAEEFKRRGHNVTIIAPTDHRDELNGIRVYWLSAPKKQYSQILSSLKFNVRLLRKYLHFVRKTDLFFIHNTISAAFLPFLKKIFRFKFVLDITDIHAEYLPIGKRNIFEKMLTPYLMKFEYFIINSADVIIVVTEAMKKLLISKKINAGKIKVVYDGTDPGQLPVEKENQAEYGVIHLGTIDRQHGVEFIIQAIPLVVQAIPSVKFFFVGGGRELNNIKKMAAKSGIENNCLFTGFISCQEARNYLKNACIGLIPRLDTLPNRIVTTLKLYEYWAGATAVIATRLEGISEIAEDGKDIIFFESGNSFAMAEKIISLLKNKEQLNHLVSNGLKKVNRFKWDNLIPQIVNNAEPF